MKNKELIVFFVLLALGTTWSYIPLLTKQPGAGTFYLMWSPGFAAIVTCLVFRRNLKGFGWMPPKFSWQAVAYFMPILYSLVGYAFVWLTGLGGFPNPEFLQNVQKSHPNESATMAVASYLCNLMVIHFIPNMIKPIGEELGWRGFLLPELTKRMSAYKASLIIGVIWAVWHYPAILFTGYNPGTPGWFAIPCFTIMVIAASFITAWLRLRSKSVWPCAIWHSSHNAIVQGFFTPITIERAYTKFFIDEFGITLVITIAAAAILCWRMQPVAEESEQEVRD